MMTLQQYFHGYDRTHGLLLSVVLREKAQRTVDLMNALLALARVAGIEVDGDPVRSGWRPPDVNARTKNASATSLHMSCEACDIEDVGQRLARWLKTPAGRKALEDLGLWMEEPVDTPSWVHLQVKPPPSGKRYFFAR